MKILVTGALGFIGSNITERLVKEGHEVVALDNMHTGSDANIAAVKGRIRVIKADAGAAGKMGERFDAILHNGVYSSSPMYRKEPEITARAMADWISILEYVRKHECRLVFASSCSVYNGNKLPFKEDMPIRVTDFYTEVRYGMERLADLYNQFYGIKTTGLRYFSVYGPHEQAKKTYANVITQFLWAMRKGERPVILGDGKQTRDFVYVEDVVEANLLALKAGRHGIFNVGTGKAATFNEVLALLNRELGTSVEPAYEKNGIKNYVAATLADTSKAKKELGFTARVGLEDGIRRLVGHYPG